MIRPRRPLAGIDFSLVGPGRVGASLAHWAVAAGARPVAVAGRGGGSGARLASELGAGRVTLDALTSHGQELLLIAVPDPVLEEVAESLAARAQAAVALHTSGSRDASALASLRRRGSAAGSLHPLKAFPRPLPDLAAARGTVFAVDGDAAARRTAARLVAAWGGRRLEVPAGSRTAYHLAASLAAGGVVTLVAAAAALARRAGLPGDEAAAGLLDLARGALEQAGAATRLEEAITGPVARADRETVERHLDALDRIDPALGGLVRALARETLRRLAETGPDAGRDALARSLEGG